MSNPFYSDKSNQAKRVRGQSATPPAATAALAAPDALGPRLWLFTHAVQQYPATLAITVSAPTQSEARGVAYLLAEDFAQKIIGQLKTEGI
jgi:hypothetical protein